MGTCHLPSLLPYVYQDSEFLIYVESEKIKYLLGTHNWLPKYFWVDASSDNYAKVKLWIQECAQNYNIYSYTHIYYTHTILCLCVLDVFLLNHLKCWILEVLWCSFEHMLD